MKTHISLVAILHIVFSILGIIGAIFFQFLFNIIGDIADDMEAEFILNIVGSSLAVFLFIVSIPGLIGGIGLLKNKEWARILVIIVSALELLNFPLGTVLGVYSIWALVQPEVIAEFKNPNQIES